MEVFDAIKGVVYVVGPNGEPTQVMGPEILKRLTQPVEDLVGKPAPTLPAEGWVGGQRPDLAGRPFLLHFWATWCGPCKNDLPRLKTLAERGATILGMHPAGTPAEEVEKFIRDEKLGYPTFLSTDRSRDGNSPRIGDYPAGVLPYCILIDAQGKVAGHGSLSEVLEKHGADALLAPRKGETKK
jgi:thiol-disulfide isomerase/thioredoxin